MFKVIHVIFLVSFLCGFSNAQKTSPVDLTQIAPIVPSAGFVKTYEGFGAAIVVKTLVLYGIDSAAGKSDWKNVTDTMKWLADPRNMVAVSAWNLTKNSAVRLAAEEFGASSLTAPIVGTGIQFLAMSLAFQEDALLRGFMEELSHNNDVKGAMEKSYSKWVKNFDFERNLVNVGSLQVGFALKDLVLNLVRSSAQAQISSGSGIISGALELGAVFVFNEMVLRQYDKHKQKVRVRKLFEEINQALAKKNSEGALDNYALIAKTFDELRMIRKAWVIENNKAVKKSYKELQQSISELADLQDFFANFKPGMIFFDNNPYNPQTGKFEDLPEFKSCLAKAANLELSEINDSCVTPHTLCRHLAYFKQMTQKMIEMDNKRMAFEETFLNAERTPLLKNDTKKMDTSVFKTLAKGKIHQFNTVDLYQMEKVANYAMLKKSGFEVTFSGANQAPDIKPSSKLMREKGKEIFTKYANNMNSTEMAEYLFLHRQTNSLFVEKRLDEVDVSCQKDTNEVNQLQLRSVVDNVPKCMSVMSEVLKDKDFWMKSAKSYSKEKIHNGKQMEYCSARITNCALSSSLKSVDTAIDLFAAEAGTSCKDLVDQQRSRKQNRKAFDQLSDFCGEFVKF